jgi:hypothetical protein
MYMYISAKRCYYMLVYVYISANRCYYIVQNQVNWTTAVSSCQSAYPGASLATISNLGEQRKFLYSDKIFIYLLYHRLMFPEKFLRST